MRSRSLVLLVLSSCLSIGLVGCAASTEEEVASGDAALSEYDAVRQNGTKVESDTTPTATHSAKTRLVGYIPGTTISDVADQLLQVDRWTSIRSPEGEKPFLSGSVESDTTSAGVRTVDGKVTLDGDIPLALRATMRDSAEKALIQFTNTTGYKHWAAGKILEPGKLTIEVKLVPLEGGVIVDATMAVKLEKMEAKAGALCASLPLVFDWLASE